MWHTSQGDRTLGGCEARLVSEVIAVMVDDLQLSFDREADAGSEEDAWSTGVDLYDGLTLHQQMALLHEVSFHLLTPTSGTPAPNASTEATIAAIFAELKELVAMEVDLFGGGAESADCFPMAQQDPPHYWRSLVLEAFLERCEVTEETNLDTHGFAANARCDDHGIWEGMIEMLCGQILWDRDFEMLALLGDVPPERAHQMRQVLGVDQDYFVRVAPDPTPGEIPDLIADTRSLLNRKPR
ncbi:MAG: hypothetical protein AAGD07_13060 [Planctomycetota bacterium]